MSLIEGVFNGRAGRGGGRPPPPVHAPELRDERRTHPRRARRRGGDERGGDLARQLALLRRAHGVPAAAPGRAGPRSRAGGAAGGGQPSARPRGRAHHGAGNGARRQSGRRVGRRTRWAQPGSRGLPSSPTAGTCTQRGRTRGIGSPSSSATSSSPPRSKEWARSAPCSSRCSPTSPTTGPSGSTRSSRARPRAAREPRAAPPENGVFTAPHCATPARVAAGAFTWHVNACLNGQVPPPRIRELRHLPPSPSRRRAARSS